MKVFVYFFFFYFFSQPSLWAQGSSSTFVSAEEQIVYNKQQQRPKYENILIQYNFNLSIAMTEHDIEELIVFSSAHFLETISVEIVESNGRYELQVLTEGNRINHEKAQEIILVSRFIDSRKSRQYWLRP